MDEVHDHDAGVRIGDVHRRRDAGVSGGAQAHVTAVRVTERVARRLDPQEEGAGSVEVDAVNEGAGRTAAERRERNAGAAVRRGQQGGTGGLAMRLGQDVERISSQLFPIHPHLFTHWDQYGSNGYHPALTHALEIRSVVSKRRTRFVVMVEPPEP